MQLPTVTGFRLQRKNVNLSPGKEPYLGQVMADAR
jgi:hypothetical protein